MKKLSHLADPATSRQSASHMVASGQIGTDQGMALALVRNVPGSTAKEMGVALASEAGADHWDPRTRLNCADAELCRQRIGRRLNELEHAKLIYRKGTRDGCARWWPTNQGDAE